MKTHLMLRLLTIIKKEIPMKNKIINIHPGEILKTEYLEELGIKANHLSIATGIPRSNLSEILKGKRGITADISLRIGKFFNQSEGFWLNLQFLYEMSEAKRRSRKIVEKIKSYETLKIAG